MAYETCTSEFLSCGKSEDPMLSEGPIKKTLLHFFASVSIGDDKMRGFDTIPARKISRNRAMPN